MKKNKISKRVTRPNPQQLCDVNQPEEGDIVVSPKLPGVIGFVTGKCSTRRRDALPAFGGSNWMTEEVTVIWLYKDRNRDYVDENGYLELKAEKRIVYYERHEFNMLIKVGNIDPEHAQLIQYGCTNKQDKKTVDNKLNADRPRCCEVSGKLQHHDDCHPTFINEEFSLSLEATQSDEWIKV